MDERERRARHAVADAVHGGDALLAVTADRDSTRQQRTHSMEVVILDDAEASAGSPPTRSRALLTQKPDAVLGLATGSSPLADLRRAGRPLRRRARSRSRRPAASPSTSTSACRPTTRSATATSSTQEFVSRVDFAPGAVQGPDGLADDIPAACAAYEAAIAAAGGVDLQILGIGTDGHIAFNEPGSSLASRTRIKTLTAADAHRQRALLRRRPRRGAAPTA